MLLLRECLAAYNSAWRPFDEFRQVDKAIAELEATAHAYEEALAQPRIHRTGRGPEYAEQLVQILLLLVHAYPQAENEQQVQATGKRLLTIHEEMPERHESNVRFLLHVAEFFHKRMPLASATRPSSRH